MIHLVSTAHSDSFRNMPAALPPLKTNAMESHPSPIRILDFKKPILKNKKSYSTVYTQQKTHNLLDILKDIDDLLINGKAIHPMKRNQVSRELQKYQIGLPNNINIPLCKADQDEQIQRIDLLKKVHVLAFGELGFWNQDNTWQTRKPVGKNSCERNRYSNHQHSVAKNIVECLKLEETPPRNIESIAGSVDMNILRAMILRASLNGLTKRPAFSIMHTSTADLVKEVQKIIQLKRRYEHLNSAHIISVASASTPLRSRDKFTGFFTSTRTKDKTGSIKEFCKFVSEVKTIAPKEAILRTEEKQANGTKDPTFNVDNNGLSSLGIIAGFFGFIEASAGFLENIKELRYQLKQNYFDKHIKEYYRDNCDQYTLKSTNIACPQYQFDYFYSALKKKSTYFLAQQDAFKDNTV